MHILTRTHLITTFIFSLFITTSLQARVPDALPQATPFDPSAVAQTVHLLAKQMNNNAVFAQNAAHILTNGVHAQNAGVFAKICGSIKTTTNAILNWQYLPYAIGGGAVVAGGGYYWYRKQRKKIDWTPNYDQSLPRCELEGMIGACPPDVCDVVQIFKEFNEKFRIGVTPKPEEEFDNTLILEGPSGIGKTTTVQAMAQSSGSHFFLIQGQNILNSFIGGAKDYVNNQIDAAIAEAEAMDKAVIIFIDEIDSISSQSHSGAHTEYQAAYKAIWQYIDKYKNNPRVCFVFATNHMNKLPAELLNRADLCIHMKRPDALQRKELLHHFSKKHTKKELQEYCSDDCIEKLVRETKNCSVRNISRLCRHAYKNATKLQEPIARKHLMRELVIQKQRIEAEQTPTREDKEEQDRVNAKNWNLFNGTCHGISTVIGILTYLNKPQDIPIPQQEF